MKECGTNHFFHYHGSFIVTRDQKFNQNTQNKRTCVYGVSDGSGVPSPVTASYIIDKTLKKKIIFIIIEYKPAKKVDRTGEPYYILWCSFKA